MIAQIIQSKQTININDNEQIKQFRSLTRFCEKLKSQHRFYKQELSVLMERICPEFNACFSNMFLNTPLMIMEEYFVNGVSDKKLIKAITKTSRGRINQTKAQKVVLILKNSLGRHYQYSNNLIQLKMLLKSLNMVKQQIDEIKKQIEKQGRQFKQFKYISSVKGVSLYMAGVVLAEIGSIDKFSRKDKLTAYAGLDASVKQSGRYIRKQANHISKRGSKYLRRQLYYAAKTAIIFDPQLKQYYLKKKAQGKHYNVIMIAVARKILMRIYAVLKQKRPYELRNAS